MDGRWSNLEWYMVLYGSSVFLCCLVGGGFKHDFYVPWHTGMVVIPTDEVIFQDFFYTTNQLLLMPKMSMQTHHHHQAGFVDLNVNEAPGRRINSAAARILRLPRTSNLRSLSRLHRKRRLTPNSDVVFIPKDWLHLGFLWYGCDIEYKIAWLNDSETWLSWLLLGPQNLNDHNFRENQQSPINLG